MNLSNADIENLLLQRLEEVKKERISVKERIDTVDNKLKECKRLAGQPPRESENELQVLIAKLERTHATTPQTNAEERKFMFELDKLKQKKKSAATYNRYSGEIESCRNQITAARAELLEKEAAIDELSSGLRKIRLATRSGCNSSELIETSFTIEETKIAQIIGRGGSNVKSIENDLGVTLDIDHLRGTIRITGTPSSINKAYEEITRLMDTVSDEFHLSMETITCLTMRNYGMVNELSEQFQIRIDLSSAKLLCKLVGLSQNVAAGKKEILAIASGRTDIIVDKSFFPSIIGKGGENMKQLTSEYKVTINLNRDTNTIEVIGNKADVHAVVGKIKEIIDENREVEEIIKLEKHVLLGCLIGSNGQPQSMRNIAKEFSVRIDTEGTKEDKYQMIKIKGNNGRVQPAKNRIVSVIQTFIADSVMVEIADEIIPALLGKGGSGIKAMREKYSEANIDIDATIVHIHSKSPTIRQQILEEINAIVGENYVETIEIDEDFGIMLKSQRAAEIREKLIKELNLRMNIEKDSIKLKGLQAHVKQGIALLQALKSNYHVATMQVSDEDYPILLKAGEDSLIKSLSATYSVDITANRKDLTLLVRGNPSNVERVIAFISGFLNGNESCGSQMLPLDSAVSPSFIGKAGANVKKMEEELGVKFDLLKSKNLLRIRGDAAKVVAAKAAVLKYLLATRVTETVSVPKSTNKSVLDDLKRKVMDMFICELEINADNESVNIRGAHQVLADAKKYVEEHLSGKSSFALPLLDHHVEKMRNDPNFGLNKFKTKFGVNIRAENGFVRLEGDLTKVSAAKIDFIRAIFSMFPRETGFMQLSRSCLRDIITAQVLIDMEKIGAKLYCDRTIGFLWLACGEEYLRNAQIIIDDVHSPWRELNATVVIEDFMIPMILGKSGATIIALRKETNCSLEIDRGDLKLDIKATSPQELETALTTIENKIRKLKAEHFETKIHPDLIPLLIGKQGANISKFRTETGVNIEVETDGTVKLNGDESKMEAAKTHLQEFITYEEKYRTLPRSFHLPIAVFPILIGTKGATIKQLQESCGAKLDLDRDAKKCTLRGKNEDCEKALDLINEILEKEGYSRISKTGPPPKEEQPTAAGAAEENDEDEEELEGAALDAKNKAIIPGANPTSLQKSQMSKSALKRLRKKERMTKSGDDDDEEEEVENQVAELTIAPSQLENITEEEEEGDDVAAVVAQELPAVIMPISPAASPKKLAVDEPTFMNLSANKPVSFETAQQLPAAPITAALSVNPATNVFSGNLASAPPQQLVNFLLGKDSSPPPGFSLPAKPLVATPLSHNPFPVPTTSNPVFSTTSSSRMPYASQYFPNSTAVNDAVFMATGVNLQHPHSSLGLATPPPGLAPNGANKTNTNFQPAVAAPTRPVAPVGPPAVPTAPVYSSIDLRTQREPVSTTVISTASTTPTNNSANSNYYKSKSGISVRL